MPFTSHLRGGGGHCVYFDNRTGRSFLLWELNLTERLNLESGLWSLQRTVLLATRYVAEPRGVLNRSRSLAGPPAHAGNHARVRTIHCGQ